MGEPRLTALDRKHRLDAAFATLVAAATAGSRCPENGTHGLSSTLVSELAHAGRVKVEVSGRNYRTVTILEGPAKGKQTAPDPAKARISKVVDAGGTRVNGRIVAPRDRDRPQPSLAKITAFGGD